jgi:hypothetical protein
MHPRVSITLLSSSLIAGIASAQSTQAVEWKVSEGGNGHWYGLRTYSSVLPWAQADLDSQAIGGHLATVLSESEDVFVFSVANSPAAWQGVLGPWLGGKQVPNSGEPLGTWIWCTGEPWVYVGPDSSFPNNGSPPKDENRLHYIDLQRVWNDISEDGFPEYQGGVRSMIVEWDADCNADGIVDYGQIRSGQLSDDNANGIPDICETSITGVIPPSVPAQGGSAISINGRNFPAQPTVLVGGVPATNVVRVSEARLTATTPALLPGMASVSVNGFTLADGIYIRPECGSDLDQDGEVSASDIAIVLLDFGPCYATATDSRPEDLTPFMLRERPERNPPKPLSGR